jgi:thiopeptide-type bacteriocin biosynthesis protein
LIRDLFPALCAWSLELIREGQCRRIAFDSYDRELERFGGSAGTAVAETLFTADSRAAVELLHLLQSNQLDLDRMALATITVDALLLGMGLDASARLQWCKTHAPARKETSGDYRSRTRLLRGLIGGHEALEKLPGGAAAAEVLVRLRTAAAEIADLYVRLAANNEVDRPLNTLLESFVHLHLNRLLGEDAAFERHVLGLLWRVHEGLRAAPHSPPSVIANSPGTDA